MLRTVLAAAAVFHSPVNADLLLAQPRGNRAAAQNGNLSIANWDGTIANQLLNENQGWKKKFFVGDPLVQPGNLPNRTAKAFAEEYLYIEGEPVTAGSRESMGIIFQLKWAKVEGAETMQTSCSKKKKDSSSSSSIVEYTTAMDGYSVGDNLRGVVWDDASPGGVGIDSESGGVYASPEREGNYVAWLVATNVRGTAPANGIAPELDQVLLKRWDFSVCPSNAMGIDTMVVIVFGCISLLVIVVAFVIVYRAREHGWVRVMPSDPLSKIEQDILANEKVLAESVKATAKYKQEFDEVYENTCASYFQGNSEVEKRLEALHQKCTLQAIEAGSIMGEYVQSGNNLGFSDAEEAAIPLYRRTLLKMLLKEMLLGVLLEQLNQTALDLLLEPDVEEGRRAADFKSHLSKWNEEKAAIAAEDSSGFAQLVPVQPNVVEGAALDILRERQLRSADRRLKGWAKVRDKFPVANDVENNIEFQIADLLSEMGLTSEPSGDANV